MIGIDTFSSGNKRTAIYMTQVYLFWMSFLHDEKWNCHVWLVKGRTQANPGRFACWKWQVGSFCGLDLEMSCGVTWSWLNVASTCVENEQLTTIDYICMTICITLQYVTHTHRYTYNYINSRSTKHVEVDIYTRITSNKAWEIPHCQQLVSDTQRVRGPWRAARVSIWMMILQATGFSWIFGGVWNVALGGWEGWKQKAWKHKIGKTHADWFRKRNESFRML